MTNIIQMENRLKSAPDEALLKEMQRPTGQAPQFLILNELNRRKNTRQEYSKRLQEGQQTTVAEDIVAPSAPPMASPMSTPQDIFNYEGTNQELMQELNLDPASLPGNPVQGG